MADHVDRNTWSHARSAVTARWVPLFEIVSCHTIRIADIKARRFSLGVRADHFTAVLRVQVCPEGTDSPVYERVHA